MFCFTNKLIFSVTATEKIVARLANVLRFQTDAAQNITQTLSEIETLTAFQEEEISHAQAKLHEATSALKEAKENRRNCFSIFYLQNKLTEAEENLDSMKMEYLRTVSELRIKLRQWENLHRYWSHKILKLRQELIIAKTQDRLGLEERIERPEIKPKRRRFGLFCCLKSGKSSVAPQPDGLPYPYSNSRIELLCNSIGVHDLAQELLINNCSICTEKLLSQEVYHYLELDYSGRIIINSPENIKTISNHLCLPYICLECGLVDGFSIDKIKRYISHILHYQCASKWDPPIVHKKTCPICHKPARVRTF